MRMERDLDHPNEIHLILEDNIDRRAMQSILERNQSGFIEVGQRILDIGKKYSEFMKKVEKNV